MIKTGCKALSAFMVIVLIVTLCGAKPVMADETDDDVIIYGETSLGGLSYYLESYYDTAEEEDSSVSLLSEHVKIPENVAIANVNDYLNIREKPGTQYDVVGYLPKDGYCVVEEVTEDGWAKIKSGAVLGYVSVDYLYMSEAGKAKAAELACLMATVNAGTVNFRSEPSTVSADTILATVSRGEVLKVSEESVISKEDEVTLWVKVFVDDMEGYVAKQFVDVAYDWIGAVSMTSILGTGSSSGLSALRASLVIEAKKHLGLKYVWGGNSLETGADCSGYCRAVYKKCGIDISKLPRTSADLASSSKGRPVSLKDAKPGDLVFYGTSGGTVNHVAMYIGGGQIIHESGRAYGCRISNVGYRTIIKIKNFLD